MHEKISDKLHLLHYDLQELSKIFFVLHIYLLIVLQNCDYLIVVGLYL